MIPSFCGVVPHPSYHLYSTLTFLIKCVFKPATHNSFLFCPEVNLFACVSATKAITSGMMIWTPYDWLNKFYSFYMAAAVVFISRHCLRIEEHCKNQSYKTKLSQYKPLLSFL